MPISASWCPARSPSARKSSTRSCATPRASTRAAASAVKSQGLSLLPFDKPAKRGKGSLEQRPAPPFLQADGAAVADIGGEIRLQPAGQRRVEERDVDFIVQHEGA